MTGRGPRWDPIRMDKQTSATPSPWLGMLACAAISTAGFLATASVARAFLP